MFNSFDMDNSPISNEFVFVSLWLIVIVGAACNNER